MIFRRGTPVFAEAERFGELVDVVVDPFTYRVTDLVVDPGGDHQQSRLIPLWLVSPAEGRIRVVLPDTHVRQLQRALESDYVRLSAKAVTEDRVDGFKTVLALPHFRDDAITKPAGGLPVEGIARHSCEIRRSSWVIGSTDRVLGTVAGLLVDGDVVHSVIVRSGVIGYRHNVAVPMSKVTNVASHFLTLSIDRHEFKREPVTKALAIGGVHLRPAELWREVLGRPTNKLWDSFEIDPPPDQDLTPNREVTE